MRLHVALGAVLIVAMSCREGAAPARAQSVGIDRRHGISRLDSSFGVNDPYAGFARPGARALETPGAVRAGFVGDLDALFGPEPVGREQLDSLSDLLLFHIPLNDSLTAYVMHVSDLMAGDRYFLRLASRARVSAGAWSWYGPAPRRGMAPRILEMKILEPGAGQERVAVNEWRHNGDVYYAWLRTLLDVGSDLSLTQAFRYEVFSNLPFGDGAAMLGRKPELTADSNVLRVNTTLIAGGQERPVGSVTLRRMGEGWEISSRDVKDRKYEGLIWSANPLGEAAVFGQAPDAE